MHFDICQKVARLGNQGLFGFAGDVTPAGLISRRITGTYKNRGVGWLKSESEVLGLLSSFGSLTLSASNKFLVAFMDDTELGAGGRSRATLVRFSTDGDYAMTRLGIELIGSGSGTYNAIRSKYTDFLKFGGTGRRGQAFAQMALFMSEVVIQESKANAIDSVGGLMQVHFIEQDGVRAIPYERWVDIDDTHGTYVVMEIDADGAWVQVHKPLGLRVPLRFPGEKDFGVAQGNFELERLLTKDSPGVRTRPNPVLVHRPFQSDSGEWLVRVPTP